MNLRHRHAPFSDIPFVAQLGRARKLSAIACLIALATLAFQGLEFGLEFTGGTVVEFALDQNADTDALQDAIEGDWAGVELSRFGVGNRWLLRVPDKSGVVEVDRFRQVISSAVDGTPDIDILKLDRIGPRFGEELREDGGLSLLTAMVLILIYVAFRFVTAFGVAAVVALLHDVWITIGLASLLRLEVDMTVLSAILAIIGYSLNDTIVIADRIRENYRIYDKKPKETVIDMALNSVLGRTVITGLTTLLALASLLLFGGDTLFNFALLLIFGVIVGTYSSIFVVPAVLIHMQVDREAFEEREVEEEENYGRDYS